MPRVPGTRRWKQMGVELEGGWTVTTRAALAATVTGAQAHGDGSVRDVQGDRGEIVTRAHTILDNLCKDVIALYPQQVNSSCGLHIHTSFVDNKMSGDIFAHSLLASNEFYDYFRDRWRLWGEAHDKDMGHTVSQLFWARWHGQSTGRNGRTYCANTRSWAEQLSNDNQDLRYTALNFSAWHKYKTVENRILPMMPTAELAVLAIREQSDIYDSFLNEHKFPVIKYERCLKEEGELLVEEHPLTTPNTQLLEVVNPVKEVPFLDIHKYDGPESTTTFDSKIRDLRGFMIMSEEDMTLVLPQSEEA